MFNKLYNSELRDKKRIVSTEDGSKTLYSYEFDECYHSRVDGALNESINKHIAPAFRLTEDKNSLNILDICFGLGFNTLTTILYYKKYAPDKRVHIVSPELDEKLVKTLKDFDYPDEFKELKEIIDSISKNFFYEDEQFKVEVIIGDARELIKDLDIKFDIIYQDAFSPKKNPALWSIEWFNELKNISKDEVVLTTYSVATPVRLSLYEAGFSIYEIKESRKKSTVASLSSLPLKAIDMELKKMRNPTAKVIRDSDYL